MAAFEQRPALRRSLSNMRWYVVNMARWAVRAMRRQQATGQAVFIDLGSNPWHRYLHILVLFLHMAGYAVWIRHRWRFIGSWASADLFRRGSFRITFRGPGSMRGALLLTDDPAMSNGTLLDADYFLLPGERDDGIRVPMPMVDSAYLQGVHLRTPTTPHAVRQRGVFFFGNMERAAYSRSEPMAIFGCHDRMRTLDTIRSRLPHRVHEPDGPGRMNVEGERDIVLVDRRRHYIVPTALPKVLARFDFFLAPSGVVMPLCHNLVEAMFAGCIPILQHAHLFDPPLRHGIECLWYRDEEELLDVLERIRTMPGREVIAMREAVLDYYHAHLAPEAVVGRLMEAGRGRTRVRLNAELTSALILRKKLDATGIHGPLPFPPRH